MHITGKPILGGHAQGPVLLTDKAVNLTAAFAKATNLLPWKRSEFRNPRHPWFGRNVKGKVIFIPACIGSTHTGLVVLDLVRLALEPAAIVVEDADPLLVSGVVLSEVWYVRGIPMVECPISPLASAITSETVADVNGDTGEIVIR